MPHVHYNYYYERDKRTQIESDNTRTDTGVLWIFIANCLPSLD